MRVWQRRILVTLLGLVVLLGIASRFIDPGVFVSRQQAKNDELLAEAMAFHVGTLAYLYGYPIVDMLAQMHNETHWVDPDQSVYAPINRFYRFPGLVTPTNSGNLRAPNSDTLYFTAWYDLSEGPVVLSTPDTQGRYFTIAVTNLYAEASHIGRRTTGTQVQHHALIPPGWEGDLPEGVQAFPVESSRGWLLGRMYVAGPDDLTTAESLVAGFTLTEAAQWPARPAPWSRPDSVEAQPLAPHDSFLFFQMLDQALRALPARPAEQALLDQFRQIGIGADTPFDAENLSHGAREGLERALAQGQTLVEASTRRTITAYNGWMMSFDIGRYGFQYLHRASVAKGGYGNLPEESLYPAAVFDANGELLSGAKRYRVTFPAEGLPPTQGFWSLAAYDLWLRQLVENPIERYAIGDRTDGLRFNADGSLTLYLQHAEPEQGVSNWLPIPEGYFLLVMRLYEPEQAALEHAWLPPKIDVIDP